jgi:hypothetical protein
MKTGQILAGLGLHESKFARRCGGRVEIVQWEGDSALSLPNHPQQHTTSPVNKLATILYIFTALLFPPPAQAWSGAGHQVIAAQAYHQLPPNLQKKVTEILKSHPDYEKWKDSFTGDSANLDLPAFIFIRSSTWPDEIRRRMGLGEITGFHKR